MSIDVYKRQIQAWSVLQHGYFKGNFVGNEEFAALNHVLNDLAKKYQVTPTAIALAWVLRYPGKMQAVIGTTKPQHVLEAGKSAEVTLTRKEWYQIHLADVYKRQVMGLSIASSKSRFGTMVASPLRAKSRLRTTNQSLLSVLKITKTVIVISRNKLR